MIPGTMKTELRRPGLYHGLTLTSSGGVSFEFGSTIAALAQTQRARLHQLPLRTPADRLRPRLPARAPSDDA
jgi:hypothetical protein